jgi:protein-S-isoprenylcysteine O-methyltransferase Ste14
MRQKNLNQKVKLDTNIIFRAFLLFIIPIIIIFVTAGTLNYLQGWIIVGLDLFFISVIHIVLKNRRDLIKERLKPGIGMKKWDKIYYLFSTPIFFLIYFISVLDATHFYWKPQIPVFIIFFGIILYSIGQIIFIWAMKTNPFFSSVVRIQTERKHIICKEGPYNIVRHPGYLGALIFTISTPLVLGSFWGLIPTFFHLILIFGRTYHEDKILQQELDGYLEYIKQIKYRMIPRIW